jgi:RHS repeat-associated protein
LWSGFIERQYKSCGLDGIASSADLCWGSDNASMMLNGQSTQLIRDPSWSATNQLWRPANDDGSRILHKTGAANADNDGEYWAVTTPDGTTYFFGRTRLDGWVTGNPETSSTWTVPVYGDDANEPCHGASFAASSCRQAWRWNLDYVVDPHQNTMSYFYTPETNFYNQNGGTAVSYDRGGQLTKIVYGTRVDANFANAPAQVVFTAANRCSAASCTLATNQGSSWPDTPVDQFCGAAAGCTGHPSPTFWTQAKLTDIATSVRNTDGTYRPVDDWALHYIFPATLDPTSPSLWLHDIVHTGKAATTNVAVPAVQFDGAAMNNRVDGTDTLPPLNKLRITQIHNETGGLVQVNYYPAQCVAGQPKPAQDANIGRCYPVYWVPKTAAPLTDWFHKYVVKQVRQIDPVGGNNTTETDYNYVGGAAWHYPDNDELSDPAHRTWSQWRGYDQVEVRTGDPITDQNDNRQTYQVLRYYRGMDGDRTTAGGTSTATVTDSDGNAHTDTAGLDGFEFEQRTFNGPSGAEVSRTSNNPSRAVTASHSTDQTRTVNAAMVHTATTITRVALAAGGFRTTRADYTYDDFGNLTQADDQGDTTDPNDNQCITKTYTPNTTAWLTSYAQQVTTVGVRCATTPTYPADAIGDVRTTFDSHTFGAAPTVGDATKVEQVTSYTGSTPTFMKLADTTYDAYGRVTSVSDPLNRVTSTAFTPATGGPVTSTATTSPAPINFVTTTTLDPAWGLPLITTDPNNDKTERAYDALGRLTSVWTPIRPRTTSEASYTFAYSISNTAASSVTGTKFDAIGDHVIAGITLYDGFLRQRQTQIPSLSGQGGRLITDTFYNARGQVMREDPAFVADGPPRSTLAEPDTLPPARTFTDYDGANRVTASRFNSTTGELWHTTTTYGGDRVNTTPPAGGTATTTITNARGQTTELRQYTGATPTGTYDATTYDYTKAGKLKKITDPAGNHWDYTYDLLGRKTTDTDPDKGTTTLGYDDAGQLTTTTDTTGQTLAFAYDNLGRKTGEYLGSLTGTQLAGWAYDTGPHAKGRPGLSTRYVNGQPYITSGVTNYDAEGLPEIRKITIPAAEAPLNKTYTYGYDYNPDDSMGRLSLPPQPGLNSEDLTYGHDAAGNQTSLSGSGSPPVTYVPEARYTDHGAPAVLNLDGGGQLTALKWAYDATTQRLTNQSIEIDTTVRDITGYTYDPAGNLKSTTDTPDTGPADTQCFNYDYLRRLTEAWTPNTTTCGDTPATATLAGPAPYWTTYGYDRTGNRTSLTSHSTTGGADTTRTSVYPAPGQAQPHALQSVTTGGTTASSYTYNPLGDTSTRTVAGGPGQTLTYDIEGHLATVADSAGATSYTYDADGNRILAKDATGTTVTLPNLEIHANPDGTTTSTRYYPFAGATIAVRTSAGGLTWLAPDPHGTDTRAITPATGAISVRRTDPFGNPRGTQPVSWPGDHGFIGGTLDPTGLTHLGAREYDPSTGRFTTVDPVLDPGDPQQLNGYAYANNNPTTGSDPTGLLYCKKPDGYDCGKGGDYDQQGHYKPKKRSGPPEPNVSYGVGGKNYKHNTDTGDTSWGNYHLPKDHPHNVTNLVDVAAWLGTVDKQDNEAGLLAGACDYYEHIGSPICSPHFYKTLTCAADPNNIDCGQEVPDPVGRYMFGAVFLAAFAAIALTTASELFIIEDGSAAIVGAETTTTAADEGVNALSYSAKITKQMGSRGWTEDSISETVSNPADTHSVWDYTTGDKLPATAYVQQGGGYVVVNDSTNEIVQVSDLNNPNWKPVWNDPKFQR